MHWWKGWGHTKYLVLGSAACLLLATRPCSTGVVLSRAPSQAPTPSQPLAPCCCTAPLDVVLQYKRDMMDYLASAQHPDFRTPLADLQRDVALPADMPPDLVHEVGDSGDSGWCWCVGVGWEALRRITMGHA